MTSGHASRQLLVTWKGPRTTGQLGRWSTQACELHPSPESRPRLRPRSARQARRDSRHLLPTIVTRRDLDAHALSLLQGRVLAVREVPVDQLLAGPNVQRRSPRGPPHVPSRGDDPWAKPVPRISRVRGVDRVVEPEMEKLSPCLRDQLQVSNPVRFQLEVALDEGHGID